MPVTTAAQVLFLLLEVLHSAAQPKDHLVELIHVANLSKPVCFVLEKLVHVTGVD